MNKCFASILILSNFLCLLFNECINACILYSLINHFINFFKKAALNKKRCGFKNAILGILLSFLQ